MWLISVPVWGDVYKQVFLERAAPALRQAIIALGEYAGLQGNGLKDYCKVVFHTDSPGFADGAFPECSVEYIRIAPGNIYTSLQYGHRDAINMAPTDYRVGLLNADLVVSRNLFAKCEQHILGGKRAIVLLGIRTLLQEEAPPVGAAPRELLSWAWDHRHIIIKDLEWGKGASHLPTNLFWSDDNSVVARGFHLHPVAIHKQEALNFISTIDGDMLDTFPRETLHIVTDPDDMALIEMSEGGKRFPVGGPGAVMEAAGVAAAMRSRASELHRWQFGHRILVRGNGAGINDQLIAGAILQYLGTDTHFLR
jgi:hypothetical protein